MVLTGFKLTILASGATTMVDLMLGGRETTGRTEMREYASHFGVLMMVQWVAAAAPLLQ